MPRTSPAQPSQHRLALLSRLLLPRQGAAAPSMAAEELMRQLQSWGRDEFNDLLSLAQSNHVVVRGFSEFLDLTFGIEEREFPRRAQTALDAERSRITVCLRYLHSICKCFEDSGRDITVIKSLDHWPDFGSDIDLYTSCDPAEVIHLMHRHFDATIAKRSWGDRLAGKWNFIIPGLPEAVEIHVGRLGQTGEQGGFASSLHGRSTCVQRGGYSFRVPCAQDRITISTLQRMYRHFYFRLCDMVDTAALVDAGGIDYDDLLASAQAAGIWEGVATYLTIISDYVESYRGRGLELPGFVISAARFGGRDIYYGKGFLRVPILPQSARLYGSQLAGVMGRGEVDSSARLSLFPWLATAAMLGQKLTGSDKGIW